jgi:hypothetical protein
LARLGGSAKCISKVPRWFAATAQVPIGKDKVQSPMIWAFRELDDKEDKTVKWVVMIVFRAN